MTTTSVPGLTVLNLAPDKGRALWYVQHDTSERQAGPYVRLRKHAEQIAADLAATGADFTQDRDVLLRDPAREKYLEVLAAWRQRAEECCLDGEHYSPTTWRDEHGCH